MRYMPTTDISYPCRDDLYTASSGKHLFYTLPAVALNYSTRYVVVIHDLRRADGTLHPPAPLAAQYISAYLGGEKVPGDERYLRFAEPNTGAFSVLSGMGVDLQQIQVI